MNLKQKKTYLIFIAISLSLLIFLANNAVAVPSLGVATGGIYAGPFEDYVDYFASGFVSGSEDNHGFDLGPSGSTLTIFTNILDYDIYLLTDTDAGGSSSPIKFDGYEFIEISYETEQADGYKPRPYYAINIGKVNGGWVAIGDDPAAPASLGSYYAYTAIIEYSGTFPSSSYFFAAADEDNNGFLYFNSSSGGSTDPFSPKTDSTTPIPEPATVLLLGTALIGLVGFKRKIKR